MGDIDVGDDDIKLLFETDDDKLKEGIDLLLSSLFV